MLKLALLVLVVILAAALFVVFHLRMVDLKRWHEFLRAEVAGLKTEVEALRRRIRLHSPSESAAPTSGAQSLPDGSGGTGNAAAGARP